MFGGFQTNQVDRDVHEKFLFVKSSVDIIPTSLSEYMSSYRETSSDC